MFYQIGLGSTQGESDIVSLIQVRHDASQHCFTGLTLVHKSTYYGVVRAWNGGLIKRNATADSDGGRQTIANLLHARDEPTGSSLRCWLFTRCMRTTIFSNVCAYNSIFSRFYMHAVEKKSLTFFSTPLWIKLFFNTFLDNTFLHKDRANKIYKIFTIQ